MLGVKVFYKTKQQTTIKYNNNNFMQLANVTYITDLKYFRSH